MKTRFLKVGDAFINVDKVCCVRNSGPDDDSLVYFYDLSVAVKVHVTPERLVERIMEAQDEV